MTLRLNVDELQMALHRCDGFRTAGKLLSVQQTLRAAMPCAVGDLCEVLLPEERFVPAGSMLCEVIASTERESQMMTFLPPAGIRPGLDVVATGRQLRVPVGDRVLGRVLDGLGQPIDSGADLSSCRQHAVTSHAPRAMTRQPITKPLVTGQRCIDSLLTIGLGQRVGLFAGSGVGKSTLMGEIARHSTADLNVIALVGERGREVRPFIDSCLGKAGLKKSVVVVATSNETPLMRIQAVRTAIAIASDFRSQGKQVLFFLDSITRLAHAQRELGLSRGETPGTRGYPPSVQNLMANCLEQLGTGETGSITGIITVLVDGDDMDEPVSDAARSILDGHLMLDRTLAARGHYPAINVLHSVSRLFNEVTTANHQQSVATIRRNLSAYEDVRELIQAGLYQKGSVPDIDEAIRRMPRIDAFVRQQPGEFSAWNTTSELLSKLVS